jgi:surface polysaccharide O-acyltransferase-like enzyme
MNATSAETIAPIAPGKQSGSKVLFIDHLKVLCTILVVLHHTFITYGAPGSWYFQQKTQMLPAQFPMTVFVATNQAFFMGFFFFLSALFVGQSYQKKGAGKFVTDRLKRLGIPLVFYSLILSPVLIYIAQHFGNGNYHSFTEYIAGFHDWIDFGVMWFVAALIVFNFVYLIYKSLHINFKFKFGFPSNKQILLFGAALGVLSFLTRLFFPTGWVLSPVGFQLGYFPQYIFLFIAGLVAANNKWLDELKLDQGKTMRRLAIIMVAVVLPSIFVAFLIIKWPGNYFNGGWNWVSLTYSLWEQITGVMIMTALLCIASFKWNQQTPLLKGLSANAYAVYIFHPLVLISLSVLIKGWNVEPALKLLIVAPAAVAGSFLLAGLLRKIGFLRAII